MPAILGTIYLTVGAVFAVAPPWESLPPSTSRSTPSRDVSSGSSGSVSTAWPVSPRSFSVCSDWDSLSFFSSWGPVSCQGALTLGIVILPTIIGATEEALKAVPQTFREASLALGVSKWLTIRKVVLPLALPGDSDRVHPGHRSRRWRDGADHVYGGSVLHGKVARLHFR